MKQLIKKSIFLFLLVSTMTTMQAQTGAQPQEVECLGVELDGSQTLRSKGKGKNKADAVEQAKKNAVWAVLFEGIHAGSAGCDMRPIVSEANAREKYEEYFNAFFRDNGGYKDYVSTEDEKRWSKEKSKNKYEVIYIITVRVLRPELKNRLRQDKILKY